MRRVLLIEGGESTRNGRFAQRNANRRLPGAESSTIVEQTAGEMAKTPGAASSGMTRGGQICIVGPPIPASTGADVTVGTASRGVISIAVLLLDPRSCERQSGSTLSARGEVRQGLRQSTSSNHGIGDRPSVVRIQLNKSWELATMRTSLRS
jgi:hypothetical protein